MPRWSFEHRRQNGGPPPAALRYSGSGCAVDLGPESERIVRWATTLAGEYGAELSLIHAGPPESRPALESLQQHAAGHARLIVETGDAAQVIRNAAQRESADLVVIGRGGAGEEGRLRSRVFGIIRNSPCPVISV